MGLKKRIKAVAEIGRFIGNCEVSKDVAKGLGITKKEADAIAWGIYAGIAIGAGYAEGLYVTEGDPMEDAIGYLGVVLDEYPDHKAKEKEYVMAVDR